MQDVGEIREANEHHWLNQKALEFLPELGVQPDGLTMHVLTFLWGLAEYPSRAGNQSFPWWLEQIVHDLAELPPQEALAILVAERPEDESQEVQEYDMARIHSPQELFHLLEDPLRDFALWPQSSD